MHKKLILASQSPRRRELVNKLGVAFSAASPTSDEILEPGLSVDAQIEKIAEEKALSVFNQTQFAESVVLGADTVVVLNGHVLGKPKDEHDARETLQKLSGKVHEVITGVCIVSSENKVVYSVKSSVKFYDLSDEQIDAYITTREPFDKAGSYSIQGFGGLFIEYIEGDYYSIMGLPISSVYQKLTTLEW